MLKFIGETRKMNLKCVLVLERNGFENNIDLVGGEGDSGRKHFCCSRQIFWELNLIRWAKRPSVSVSN
jgi:hypothetical protein